MNLIKSNAIIPSLPSLASDWYDTGSLLTNFFPEMRSGNLPSVNIKEGDTKFTIEVAAPGLSKEDFKVNLKDNVLEISAEKRGEKTEEEEGYKRREFNYSSFYRSISLPESVKSEEIKGEYKDGVLCINVPKKEEAQKKQPKQIAIS